MLDERELERYARHIVLAEVGGAGQQKLKAAKVLVIGAGGLGSPVLQYLAAAGVGTLGVIDDDTVSLSVSASAPPPRSTASIDDGINTRAQLREKRGMGGVQRTRACSQRPCPGRRCSGIAALTPPGCPGGWGRS